MTTAPPGTQQRWLSCLPPADTALHISVHHQGKTSRLRPVTCARSLTCAQLHLYIERTFALTQDDFQVEWLDDENNVYRIDSDDALHDALEFFTPSCQQAGHIEVVAAEQAIADASSSASSSTSLPPSASSSKPIDMLVRLRVPSRISLSDFGSSVGGSSEDGDSIADSQWSASERDFYGGSLETTGQRLFPSSGSSSGSSSGGWRSSASSTHSASSSRSKAPLNARRRLAPHRRRSDSSSDSSSSSSSESEDGTEYAFSNEGSTSHLRMSASVPSQRRGAEHSGISCCLCQADPIVGIRYLCIMCPGGPSFCGSCEDTGRSIQHGTHLATHAMLKLAEPLTSDPASSEHRSSSSAVMSEKSSTSVDQSASIAGTLIRAAQWLTLNTTDQDRGSTGRQPLDLNVSPAVRPRDTASVGYDVLCSFCSEVIGQSPRFLCANCPLDLPGPSEIGQDGSPTTPKARSSDGSDDSEPLPYPDITISPSLAANPHVILTPHEGYNLCEICERHSLSVHDPNHFFIKIPSPSKLAHSGGSGNPMPLRLNPYLTISHRTEGLLPELYRTDDLGWEEARARIQASSWSPLSSYVAATPAESSSRQHPGGQLATVTSSPGVSCTMYNAAGTAARAVAGETSAPKKQQQSSPPFTVATAGPSCSSSSTRLPANLAFESEYVSSLVHPSLICDICFEVITGRWLRCVHCSSSFDVCSDCEHRAVEIHDAQHSFATFKRSVDLDLFKSLVDHLDASFPFDPVPGGLDFVSDSDHAGTSRSSRERAQDWGSGRAMVPFLLV